MRKKKSGLDVKLKRAYEPAAVGDGKRILVDRLWPRGVKKEKAKIDEWMKDVSPSSSLRKWFGHDQARWEEFRLRYLDELRTHPDQIDKLRSLAGKGPLTLVFSARDVAHNNAVVLKELL